MASEIQVPIEGMTCASCATRIEKVLRRVPGVQEAAVHFATESGRVRFDPAETDPSHIVAAIERTGFQVPARELRLNIEGMTCASCAERIEKAIRRVPGVLSVQVNLGSEQATLAIRPGWDVAADVMSAVKRAGYGATPSPRLASEQEAAEAKAEARERRERWLWLGSAALTLPLMLPMGAMVLGAHLHLPALLQFVLATPVQTLAGARFYRGAFAALRGGSANMDVLVSLGTSSAYLLSLWLWHQGETELYFEAAAAVITLVRLGKWMEIRAKHSTTAAIRSLLALRPARARIEVQGNEVEVPIESVGRGDVAIIRPGERIPVDGQIIDGASDVDESMLTGESLPVHRQIHDEVSGGSFNIDGLLRIRVNRVGPETTLSQIISLVESAQSQKPPIQRVIDRVSAVFVPVVVVIAALTFLTHVFFLASGMEAGILHAVSVLVIACPCALGLATPTAILVGTGVAARQGILVRDLESMERAPAVDVVVFDKTGTLTEGRPEVVDQVALGLTSSTLLQLAASLQQGSEHPLGQALLQAAKRAELPLLPVTSYRALSGRGLEAKLDDTRFHVGNARLMREQQVDLEPCAAWVSTQEQSGRSLVFVARDGVLLGAFGLADALRAGSLEAVRQLHQRKIRPILLTGDHANAAANLAARVEISEVIADVMPADKASVIERLRAEGRTVAMVGDGINDAPALAAADVGLAMAGGTDVALHAAGIALMRADPRLVPLALSLAALTTQKIRQNLFWAFVYNVIGIPLAASGSLSPMVAGAAMAFSSVSVVTNALRLRKTGIPR